MKKRSVRKTAKARSRKPSKRRAPKAQSLNIRNIADLEEFMVSLLVSGNVKVENGTEIENLLYSVLPSTAEMGYDFGFSVGRSMALKSDSMKFEGLLDKAGMHNAIYHPFKDEVVVLSRPKMRHRRTELNSSVHVYEAGLMAGFLSTQMGERVNTVEDRCIYRGSDECKFVSVPLSTKPSFGISSVDSVAEAIAHSLMNHEYRKTPMEYYRVLAFLPLTDNSIAPHMANILQLAGRKLGAMSHQKEIVRLASNIANYFGARDIKIETLGRKRVIRLRYESYNSMYNYVAMPTALITGLSTALGKRVQTRFVTNKDRTYTTVMELIS